MHKKGKFQKDTNYRPIPVLSLFSKIFEKIIHKQLENYFTSWNTPSKKEFWFRAKHSTNHVILFDVINKLKNVPDIEGFLCLILIDLSKVFDTANYDILISKLEEYAIRGNFLKLTKNYLTNGK